MLNARMFTETHTHTRLLLMGYHNRVLLRIKSSMATA